MDSTNLVPDTSSNPIAFPRLTAEDLALLKPLATPCTYEDLLTRRPVIVSGIARGHTRLLRVPGGRLREVLNKLPHLGETMLIAAQERRRLLTQTGVVGLKVVGPGKCRDTMLVREFLFKNFVPFTWYDSASHEGRRLMAGWGSPRKSPVIECGGGKILINPGLRELAQGAGV